MSSNALAIAVLAVGLVSLLALFAGSRAYAQLASGTSPLLDLVSLSGSSPSPREPVSTVTTGRSDAASALAAGYPVPRRAEAERTFARLLDTYAKIEAALGIPPGDVAGAAAAFVIASYEAYRGIAVEQAAHEPLIDQLRARFSTNAVFGRATPAQRRALYEQLAMIGMFVAVTRANLTSSPHPATEQALRQAAKGYLQQVGLDPDRIAIDERGLTSASARRTPCAAQPEDASGGSMRSSAAVAGAHG